MIKHKRIGAAAALLMAAAVLFTGFAYLNPSAFASVSGRTQPAYASAMDKTRIMDFQIIVDEAEWANMLENARAEEYIPATVIINGVKVENVGIRPKGNSSLSTVASDDSTDRYSFKIEFDHYISGQTWLGLDKIVINNMHGDASYLKEYLSYDIMAYIGVEAPLYAFADISVNGELWGFYLAVEALEDSYAKRVYGNDHGKLYKPESMGIRGDGRMNEFIMELQTEGESAQQPQNNQRNQAQGQQNRLENFGGGMSSNGISLQYVDDKSASYYAIFDNAVFKSTENDYQRVVKALEKLSNGEDLENTVDVEAVLRYFAAHTVVVNLDSYVSNMAHNYYLYEDNGQLTILPWDYNLAFGGFQSGNASSVVNFPIDTPVSGVSLEERPLLGKLLEVPEYLDLYHEYLRQIVDGYFNSGLFEETIDAMNALISSHIEADPTAFFNYNAYQAAVTELRKLGLLRAQSVEGQLGGSIPSTSEGQRADSSRLVDASGLNISALGNQGGGVFAGGDRGQGGFNGNGNMAVPGGVGGAQNSDREAMQKAMEIIGAAGEAQLTEEQLAQLRELGLSDEQTAQLQSMNQGGVGGFGGVGNAGEPQVIMGGQRPNDMPEGNGNAENRNPGIGTAQSVITSGFDTNAWLFIGGCVATLLAGLMFVALFSRRKHA